MLKTVTTIICCIAVGVIVPIVIRWIVNKKTKKEILEENNDDNDKVRILRYSSFVRWTFIITTIGCYIIIPAMIFFLPSDAPLAGKIAGCAVFWCSFGLIFLICAFTYNSWKVEVYKEYFKYRGYLGKKGTYYYTDVELIPARFGCGCYFKKDGKKVAILPLGMVDCDCIIKLYKKAKNRNIRK